ncbi:hypothetical protein I4U23_029262 [Adineta vaga]|nr:hypothetical protein I4U23_029262 [Adineta vaga]
MKNFTSEHASYVHDYLVYKLNRNESLLEYFYSLESMLMSCSYNRMACTAANFTWFMSPQFGLCYTFNAKLKDTFNRSLKYNADNGADGLLELRLYIHQHQYVPYLSNGIGVAVLVHDNEQIPLIEMTAMKLGPGRHHKLGYVKKISTFLPAPYTSCGTVITPGMEAMYSEYHDTDYGYFELPCYYACIQSYVYSKCNCGSPHRWAARFIVPPGVDKPIHIPLCNLSDSCYTEATSEIRNTQNIWTSYCATCDQECTYNDFIIRPTSLLAPPTYLLNDIKQFVESTTIPLPHNWSTSWVTDIQSSYVSLEVAYETTRTEVYSQQATISPVDVISNVGGHTGLWIGISFLSLMEIAEMIFRLCNSQCHRLRMNVKKKLRR